MNEEQNERPNEQPNELSNGPSENSPQALYVTLILDETGSMQECKGAAITGFNQYVATLRQEPAETRVTLTLFNSRRRKCAIRPYQWSVSMIWTLKPIDLAIERRSMMRSVVRLRPRGCRCRPSPENSASF